MGSWTSFFNMGWEHILDLGAYDHMLFLLILVSGLTWKDWKTVLTEVTFFTLGHAATLLCSYLWEVGRWAAYIEIGIAITIFLAALDALFLEKKSNSNYRLAIIFIFGLIHGMGFSSSFKSMMGEGEWLTALISFNFGVEFGQIVFVAAMIVIQSLLFSTKPLIQKYYTKGIAILALALSIKMIFLG